MSAFGPKQTWAGALHMSAFGGKRTSLFAAHMSAFDPKGTLAGQDCCFANWPLSPISPVANPCCNRVLFGVVPASGKAMRRRDFIKAIAVSTAWPLAARAQQADRPRRIG